MRMQNQKSRCEYIVTQQSQYCLVTMAIGNIDYWTLTQKHLQRYAQKNHMDFHIINQRQHLSDNILFEKFQLFDLFKKYKRVMFIDADVLIKVNTPNLFRLVSPHKIGVFCECCGVVQSIHNRHVIKDLLNFYDFLHLKYLPKTMRYFNTGVVVFPEDTSFLHYPYTHQMEYFHKQKLKTYTDQTFLNYLVQQNQIHIYPLSKNFNSINIRANGKKKYFGVWEPQKDFIWHLAGCKNEYKKFKKLLLKYGKYFKD